VQRVLLLLVLNVVKQPTLYRSGFNYHSIVTVVLSFAYIVGAYILTAVAIVVMKLKPY